MMMMMMMMMINDDDISISSLGGHIDFRFYVCVTFIWADFFLACWGRNLCFYC